MSLLHSWNVLYRLSHIIKLHTWSRTWSSFFLYDSLLEPIYLCTLHSLSYPRRFPLMRILLQRWIYRSLWFFKFLIFFSSFFIHGCIMNSGCLCFFRFFSGFLSGFFVSCVFIKFHIPADVNLLVSWEIDSVSFRDFRVSHKYTLLS